MTLFRIAPLMPVHAYQTYGVSWPLKTHWRPATCEEADCDAYRNGWATTLDLSTELGRRQYYYCTHDRSRSHTEQRVSMTLVKLVYTPGQKCFAADGHRVPLVRPGRFFVAHGDYRGYMTRPRVHKNGSEWAEDFAEHCDRLNTELVKG